MPPPVPEAKAHYDRFLAGHYLWMAGGFDANTVRSRQFFSAHRILPIFSGTAIDLGAGCGFASIPLAETGFHVTAVDICQPLLDELRGRIPGPGIEMIAGDLLDFPIWTGRRPELITCMGDTLTHLPDLDSVCRLIRQCHVELMPGGKLILSFRDYSGEPDGSVVIVPVRKDGKRIFLCRLEYLREHVRVTDIIYSQLSGKWKRSASEYAKLRLAPALVREMMEQAGFRIEFIGPENGMIGLIGINENIRKI
ncbi:MAG: class I SAM-dependent methyltransferase [Methanoregula sp.]|jgi:SAM-dependent methyltransferase|uniref:class I SAM-dependent methyltransferase n=1 Tax=Methanoregula sp. TaxID=2052170 RepID=UPI0025E12BC7|nr:class I SAM-dependent methyltransferase [Methanoregula sp.]MCK9630936.1 class I SAM-dependent methyltransferase [Methanoregula sp.]